MFPHRLDYILNIIYSKTTSTNFYFWLTPK
nr:MAG TPA: hypothetical protein [Caudoviricetes sp.]